MTDHNTTLIASIKQCASQLQWNADLLEGNPPLSSQTRPNLHNLINLEVERGVVLSANIAAGIRHVARLLWAAAKAMQTMQRSLADGDRP